MSSVCLKLDKENALRLQMMFAADMQTGSWYCMSNSVFCWSQLSISTCIWTLPSRVLTAQRLTHIMFIPQNDASRSVSLSCRHFVYFHFIIVVNNSVLHFPDDIQRFDFTVRRCMRQDLRSWEGHWLTVLRFNVSLDTGYFGEVFPSQYLDWRN